MQNSYGFGKTVAHDFATAVTRVTEELGKQGFGVLTEIDVQATLKKKLDKDVPPYKILGACNPHFAHQVLDLEPTVGLLLPCNVIVREETPGRVVVGFLDPQIMVGLVGAPEVKVVELRAAGRSFCWMVPARRTLRSATGSTRRSTRRTASPEASSGMACWTRSRSFCPRG